MAKYEPLLIVQMRDRLLRAIDRRDPWSADDLIGWLRVQFPEYLAPEGNEKRAAADFATGLAGALAHDPAFPAIVDNLRNIAAELNER